MEEQCRKEYLSYVNRHVSNVINGFIYMTKHGIVDKDSGNVPSIEELYRHDSTKKDEIEFDAYAEHFYGKNKGNKDDEAFNLAWLHHIHNNKHHWQYWVINCDNGGTKALEMPVKYVIEMICDWWAFSWEEKNLYEVFDWYENNKGKQILHENTRALVEDYLEMLKKSLDENGSDVDELRIIKPRPRRELIEEMYGTDSDMLFFDTPDYDSAIVGVSSDYRVVYNYGLMAESLMIEDDMSYEEAIEFIDYNTIRALPYFPNGPIVVYPIDEYL